MSNGKKKASKKKAHKKIASKATTAKKAAKKAKKKAAQARQLSPAKARELIQETRQELRRLRDDMLDPIFIAGIRQQDDRELANHWGLTILELIEVHESLSNAVLDSILLELRENEKALRAGISDVKKARQNLAKVGKVLKAADKILAAAISVVDSIV